MNDQLRLELDGGVWFRNALNRTDIETLNKVAICEKQHGERINWDSSRAKTITKITNLHNLVSTVLPNAKPVRALVFNKSTDTNWGVPWHQDRVISVKDKHDVKGYKNWTKKSGVWHVEPPVDILEKMVFVRIHLDENTKNNGCMEIALRTHKFGYIPAHAQANIIASAQTELSVANKGDILVVKALILHRSRQSKSGDTRRTLRVDYTNQQLPAPLEWAELR
ncbi:MAG: phytanoyl-CoA dioxygenase [Robiginitomaculum sp.]|nr:MAG: phytanoyl-CoA dioxygenase [Robiginitomaculum sp.]